MAFLLVKIFGLIWSLHFSSDEIEYIIANFTGASYLILVFIIKNCDEYQTERFLYRFHL